MAVQPRLEVACEACGFRCRLLWRRVQARTNSVGCRTSTDDRLAEDDLCGTCRKLIGAMLEAVMRRAVVFVVWDSSTVTVAGSWEMSEVQRRKTVAAAMTAEGILRME